MQICFLFTLQARSELYQLLKQDSIAVGPCSLAAILAQNRPSYTGDSRVPEASSGVSCIRFYKNPYLYVPAMCLARIAQLHLRFTWSAFTFALIAGFYLRFQLQTA